MLISSFEILFLLHKYAQNIIDRPKGRLWRAMFWTAEGVTKTTGAVRCVAPANENMAAHNGSLMQLKSRLFKSNQILL